MMLGENVVMCDGDVYSRLLQVSMQIDTVCLNTLDILVSMGAWS